MSASLILLPLLAQAGLVVSAQPDGPDAIDVAYEELARGQPEAAIKRIEANRLLERDDPSRLINLGAAYAQMGDRARAIDYYRSALASPVRSDVQLSDGTWLDSRRAARMGIEANSKATAIAAR